MRPTSSIFRLRTYHDPYHHSDGVAVLGAGPAGLTAGLTLARSGVPGAVFEADDQPGGLAKTVESDGYRFDLGGHRFFTKVPAVERLWEEMLGSELLTRPRLSRIYYRGKFFSYPLRAEDVFRRLGLSESALCAASYLRGRLVPRGDLETFEAWVTSRFGPRLYDRFFRSYTEKIWGIPGSEIDSQWAAQRIRNFSLWEALLHILGRRPRGVTTLLEEFKYPRHGPGQMWEAFADSLETAGFPVLSRHRCVSLAHDGRRVERIGVVTDDAELTYEVDGVISSIALSDLIQALDPPPPADVLAASRRLRYRDLVIVALITTQEQPFPDNWIYLHDPGTRAGRVQNFGAWSEDMVQPGTTCLGLEYFAFEGDETWNLSEADAVALGVDELARIGLLDPSQVVRGVRIRVPKAYPMYDLGYRKAVATIRAYLSRFENLQTVGRNGLHRYNNQDHSMLTGMLAAANLLGASHDVWSVNADADYLEEGALVDEPRVGALLSRRPAPRMAEYL